MTDTIHNNTKCPECGEKFECGAKAGKQICWCFNLPNVMPVNAKQDCLCPRCLEKEIKKRTSSSKIL